METRKVIIIGSGPAGLTAGIYAGRAGFKPLLFGGLTYGGQLMLTTEVENFPGFPEGILGPELMQRMIKQAERFGTEVLYEDVTKVDFSSKPLKVWVSDKEYEAEAMVIATGASTMWLGLPSEERLRGKGISSCATCDGFFYKDKEIIVVGAGDAAMEEASYMTKFAKKITVLARGDKLRASQIMQDRVKVNPKIEIKFNTVVEEFLGDTHLETVKIKDVVSGQVTEMPIGGAFVAIGHKPNTEIFKSYIDLDVKGYIIPIDQTKTKVPGVFVAGDVRDFRYRQAATSAGWGTMAAMDVEKYLSESIK